MIAVLKPGASPERTQHLIHWLEEQNLGVHVSKGEYQTVPGPHRQHRQGGHGDDPEPGHCGVCHPGVRPL